MSFENANLLDVNFTNANLKNADFDEVLLRDVYFNGADLAGATFRKASVINNADFRGANLNNADFTKSSLQSIFITGAILDQTKFINAYFYDVDFTDIDISKILQPGVTFNNSNLSGQNLDDIDFSGQKLQKINFANSSLKNANLTNSVIDSVNFTNVDLNEIDFTNAYFTNMAISEQHLPKPLLLKIIYQIKGIESSNLSGLDLSGINFTSFTLKNSNLTGTNLQNVILHKSVLEGSNLKNADMKNSDLRMANLIKTNLQNTNLQNTALQGAQIAFSDLTHANFNDANMSDAILISVKAQNASLVNTDLTNIMPDWVFDKVLDKQSKLEWAYDGTIPKQGCQRLNGTIVDEFTCLYNDKTLHILSESYCDRSVRIPEDHSDHCIRITTCSESGSVLSGRTVVEGDYLQILDHYLDVEFDGDICFIDSLVDYAPYQKKITINLEGIWNEANVAITTDLPVFSKNMVVYVNDVSVPYYSNGYYDHNQRKWLGEIKFALKQSTSSYSIVISNNIDNALTQAEDELLTPYWQLQAGVLPEDVLCEEQFVRLFTISTDSPICITQKTADVLVKRGYTLEKQEKTLAELKSLSKSHPEEPIMITVKSDEGVTYWYALPQFASVVHIPPPHDKITGINVRVNDVYTTAFVYHSEGEEYLDSFDANTETIFSFAKPIVIDDVQFHFQFSGKTNSFGIRYLYD